MEFLLILPSRSHCNSKCSLGTERKKRGEGGKGRQSFLFAFPHPSQRVNIVSLTKEGIVPGLGVKVGGRRGLKRERERGREERAPSEEGKRDVNINSVNIFFKVLHVIPGNRSSFTGGQGSRVMDIAFAEAVPHPTPHLFIKILNQTGEMWEEQSRRGASALGRGGRSEGLLGSVLLEWLFGTCMSWSWRKCSFFFPGNPFLSRLPGLLHKYPVIKKKISRISDRWFQARCCHRVSESEILISRQGLKGLCHLPYSLSHCCPRRMGLQYIHTPVPESSAHIH